MTERKHASKRTLGFAQGTLWPSAFQSSALVLFRLPPGLAYPYMTQAYMTQEWVITYIPYIKGC